MDNEQNELRRERLQETLDQIERGQWSTHMRVVNEGPWVVVATLPTSGGMRGVAQMSNASASGVHDMQRYETVDMAMAGSKKHAAVRIGGAWALNLVTGETKRIQRGEQKNH